jgi:hypothetical protein
MTRTPTAAVSEAVTTTKTKMETALLLGHSADWWNAAMLSSLAIAAVAAFLVAAATTGVVVAAKREAMNARSELERYQAQVSVKIEEARADAALANERAAQFGKDAAEANLKTELLKKELGWREVTRDQFAKLRAVLNGKPMSIALFWGMGDAEGSHFAHVLAAALHNAGLVVVRGGPMGQLGQEKHGISVEGWKDDEVSLLATALQEAGYGQIDKSIVPPPPGPDAAGQYTNIFIGYREAPRL